MSPEPETGLKTVTFCTRGKNATNGANLTLIKPSLKARAFFLVREVISSARFYYAHLIRNFSRWTVGPVLVLWNHGTWHMFHADGRQRREKNIHIHPFCFVREVAVLWHSGAAYRATFIVYYHILTPGNIPYSTNGT